MEQVSSVTLGSSLTVQDDLLVSDGIFNTPIMVMFLVVQHYAIGNITVSGDWSNSGTFTHQSKLLHSITEMHNQLHQAEVIFII